MHSSSTQKSHEKLPSRTRAGSSRRASSAASFDKQDGTGGRGSVYFAAIHEGPAGAFGVVFPDVPGCYSAGESWEDAVVQAHAALAMHMRLLLADADPIPRPSPLETVRKSADAAPASRGGKVSFAPVVLLMPASRPMRVNISLDAALLAAIDTWAERHGETRSGMLAAAARVRLSG